MANCTSGHGYLKQYIRDDRREKIGIMLAFIDGDNIKVGWSVCCKEDKFNLRIGEMKAAAAAIGDHEKMIPRKYDEQIAYFCNRITRYFKDKNIPEWVVIMSEVWKNEYDYQFRLKKETHKIAIELVKLYEQRVKELIRNLK